MSPRERTMAILLIVGIVVIGGGFLGYMFIWSPLQDKKLAEENLARENGELEGKLKQFQKDARRLSEAKRRSLPADKGHATSEYFAMLDKLLINAKAAPGFSILQRTADLRGTPILSGKTPVYDKVVYEIQFKKADLWQVYDFLTGYYKLNLLHQITSITIKRDEDTKKGPVTRNDLTVTIITEGLILDGAENRRTLLPIPHGFAAVGGIAGYQAVALTPEASRGMKPIQFVPVLATKPRDYTLLVLRDIFHGPYPKPAPLGIESIDAVTARVGETISPVKIKTTSDDVINGRVSISANVKRTDGTLFPPGSVKIDKDGRVVLTPTPEETGKATITVTAVDAKGKKVERDFSVAVNLPPTEAKIDISQTILLTSVTPRSDGTAAATIRDNANKIKYEIEATTRGTKVAKIEYLGPRKKPVSEKEYGDTSVLHISDIWSATDRSFRVISVDYDGLIVSEEKAAKAPIGKADAVRGKGPMAKGGGGAIGKADTRTTKTTNALAAVVGFAATNAPQAPPQLYRWSTGKTLKNLTPIPADEAKRILLKANESGPVARADEE